MTLPTGEPTDGNTTLTSSNVTLPTVSPAQVFPTPAHDDQAEKRIRDLMSQKDKAYADANRAQQLAVQLQQQLEQTQKAHAEQIQGAVTATEALLTAKAKLEAEQAQLAAENLKLKVLLQYPDLLPYAEFIPAAGDEATVKANIERFQAARAADAARTKPVQPVQQDAAALRSLYPANTAPIVPPAQPAAAPTQNYDTQLSDFQARVKALDGLDPLTRAQKMGEIIKEAELLAKRQMGQA